MIRPLLHLSILAQILVLTAGCRERDLPLTHEAYIWQRIWSPGVIAAVDHAAATMDGWRVLAGQTDDAGHILPTMPDWSALVHSGRPVIAVIRIKRQLADQNETQLLDEVAALAEQWHSQIKTLTGIEIDHDSATARLPQFGHFLQQLRPRLGQGLRLSMTALPTWLASPDFPAVLNHVDEAVLQVHALNAPQQGIFHEAEAASWIRRMASITDKPFRVALPAYGARLALRSDGSAIAVESEEPLMAGGVRFVDLTVSPDEVATLLADLKRHRPQHLAGFVWFRLPTAEDVRAWSLTTLQAVIRGGPVKGRIDAVVTKGETPGLAILDLVNNDPVDARLPRRLDLPVACSIGDGANGYDVKDDGGIAFLRADDQVLRAHSHVIAGWARCALTAADIHVSP